MKYMLKKLLEHLLTFFGIAGFMTAIIWLLYWCGCWDAQAISQAEAFAMYPLALIPAAIGGVFFYGACKLEKQIEEEYYIEED